MYIFNVISLFGGLAMFLYGMRLMGNSLKEGSSGTLKIAMEKVTNSLIKAFFLGFAVTAIIQSSTACIVITSGLVAAGIISLDQSLGIIAGANVGTTVTGQIIRLLDVKADAASFLRFFQPSTLAPLALIIGIIFVMFLKFKKSDNIGNIAIGFGILFSGLMNMTESVSILTDSGVLNGLFEGLGNNPVLAYLTGAGVAFILQSSSASIGILQAFSMAGDIPFKAIYVVLVGIYLGDCVTTAIVCSIGAKEDSRRVGMVNIILNIGMTVLVVGVVNVLRAFGLLNELWDAPMRSGDIANCNTIFNLGCSLIMLPMLGSFAKLSRIIAKDKPESLGKYSEKIVALNPVFFATPALAFRSCYDVLNVMLTSSVDNLHKALNLLREYDENVFDAIEAEEENIDLLTDKVDTYLVQLSPHISEENHMLILDQYHKVVSEFEHLGDFAVNIARAAQSLDEEGIKFSEVALAELDVAQELMNRELDYAHFAFTKRDVNAASHIEPLEQVMDEMVRTVHDNHLERLRDGKCTTRAGMLFTNVLTNVGRVSDTCSNIGIATLARVNPDAANRAHSYITSLHSGKDESFNGEYCAAYNIYFGQLKNISEQAEE